MIRPGEVLGCLVQPSRNRDLIFGSDFSSKYQPIHLLKWPQYLTLNLDFPAPLLFPMPRASQAVLWPPACWDSVAWFQEMWPSSFVVPVTEGLLEGSDKFQISTPWQGLAMSFPTVQRTGRGARNIKTFLDLLLWVLTKKKLCSWGLLIYFVISI